MAWYWIVLIYLFIGLIAAKAYDVYEYESISKTSSNATQWGEASDYNRWKNPLNYAIIFLWPLFPIGAIIYAFCAVIVSLFC